MEQIISFLRDDENNFQPFQIEITGITYPDPNYRVDRDNSSIYCIEYIISGEGTVKLDDEIFYPSKGDIYILPYGHNHHYHSSHSNPWEKIWMNVYGPLCDALLKSYQLENVHLVKAYDLYDLFKEFLKVCEQKEISVNDTLHQCSLIFHEILSRISMHIYGNSLLDNSAAYRMKDYVRKNIYEKLTIKAIAETACLSPSQASRVFKKAYGQTPYDYVLSQRIETAKKLLLNTNMTVKEIAFKLNFADEHYFSNFFKERIGLSPIEYSNRKEQKLLRNFNKEG